LKKTGFISITRRQLRPQSIETNESKRELLDVEKYRLENGIQCFGESIADPFQSFDSYLWPKQIRDRMSDFGFTTPTPIQSQSLPIILQRRDLVAIASSGSGKTLCFVLPALVSSHYFTKITLISTLI
jgi:superfamily II DNA/RNA helicase